tara:strand:- start:435 stop:686 length:252 start_codon:yes stop_codon:yes gene_type:complete
MYKNKKKHNMDSNIDNLDIPLYPPRLIRSYNSVKIYICASFIQRNVRIYISKKEVQRVRDRRHVEIIDNKLNDDTKWYLKNFL